MLTEVELALPAGQNLSQIEHEMLARMRRAAESLFGGSARHLDERPLPTRMPCADRPQAGC